MHMPLKKFNFYGFDEKTFRECRDSVRQSNLHRLKILNTWFAVLLVIFCFLSWFNVFGISRNSFRYYILFAVVSVSLEIVIFAFPKLSEKISTVFVYANVFLLLAYGISDSIAYPYMKATMYLILVVLISVTYVDQMLRMSVISVAYTLVFLYTSFAKKPISIAYYDMYNAVVFLTLALVLHFSYQRNRVQHFVVFMENVRIQRDLEIRSSFDALTSLLNRGRFFSLAGEVLRDEHDSYMAIALLDLDSFKQINDKLGHQMGDKAIQIAGTTITETLGIDLSEKWSFTERVITDKLSFAGRLGGDEFIVLIRGEKGREVVLPLLQSMLMNLNQVEFGELHGIHASFGVTELSGEDRDIDKAYTRADIALYESKRAGKNQITFNNGELKGGKE